MMRKVCVLAILAGFLCMVAGVPALVADEGEEMLMAHPMKVYPGCIRMFQTDANHLLSKDKITKIKSFYEKNSQSGDRISPINEDNEQGFRVTYSRVIGKKEQTVTELECFERKYSGIVHDALGELMLQTKMGRHSEAEYKALEDKYRYLTSAYFRDIDNGEGGTVSEGKQIYKKAFNLAHGKMKRQKNESPEQAEGKAKAKDIKLQMQELKAKGDFAGMMKLAQESKMSPRENPSAAAAMEDMAQDTWDLWVTCLKDLDAAAYWTRIDYSNGALPAGN